MQSFLHIQSHSFPLQFPCKSIFPSNFSPQNPNFTTPHNLSLNSLKSSIDSRTQQLIEDEDKFRPRERLPIAIKKNGKVGRYFWSGNSMEIVQLDCGGQGFELGFEIGVRKLMGDCGLAVKNLFIPKQVRVNYIEYVKWKLLHRVFSSALQVLATQAMFRAIGVGYAQSLPSAAALNWVLKDGLGRLSRCIYTASVGSAFDTNLKRVRFATSILFSLSIGVELMTPAFPHCFLLLASLANIAKQISSACYLATGTAVHRSFAIADNLGEVSAKAQIQTVCFDNIGLLLAAALNMICRNNQRLQAGLPFVVYPIFSAIDLFGIYQALKHVHLQTLTKVRLEIILDTWIQFGYVLSPAQVSEEEGINLLDNTGKRVWPIRIGCLKLEKQLSELTLLTMESLSDEDYYFICMETCGEVKTGRIVVSLREGAGTADTITGLLQACYVRRVLISDPSHWEKIEDLSGISDSLRLEWLKLIEKSKHRAKGEMKQLNDQMMKLGWSGKNILLSTQEQARYSFVNDNV